MISIADNNGIVLFQGQRLYVTISSFIANQSLSLKGTIYYVFTNIEEIGMLIPVILEGELMKYCVIFYSKNDIMIFDKNGNSI